MGLKLSRAELLVIRFALDEANAYEQTYLDSYWSEHDKKYIDKDVERKSKLLMAKRDRLRRKIEKELKRGNRKDTAVVP